MVDADGNNIRTLKLPILPSTAFVSNSNDYIVFVDEYGPSSMESTAVIIYRGPELLKKWTIGDLIRKEDALRSVSSIRWFDATRTGFIKDESAFQIHLLNEEKINIDLHTLQPRRDVPTEVDMSTESRFRRANQFQYGWPVETILREYEPILAAGYSYYAYQNLNNVLRSKGKYREAVRYLLRGISHRTPTGSGRIPDDLGWLYFYLGVNYESLLQPKESLRSFLKARDHFSESNDELEREIGFAYLKNGDNKNADQAFRLSAKASRNSGLAHKVIAQRLLTEGHLELALREAKAAVSEGDRFLSSAYWVLGDVYVATKDRSNALKAYRESRRLILKENGNVGEMDRKIKEVAR